MIFAGIAFVTIAGLIWRKSRLVALIIILFDVIICAGCNEAYDIINLQNMFEQPLLYHEDVAIGWDWFFRLCIKSGMSWPLFKAICAATTLTLIYISTEIVIGRNNIVLSLYTISLLMFQMTQIRNGLAFAFAALAVAFLVKREKKGIIPFFIVIAVSILIHYSMVYYLIAIVIVISKSTPKQFFIRVLTLTIIGSVLLYSGVVYKLFDMLFSGKIRVLQYLDATRYAVIPSFKSIMLFFGGQVYMLLICAIIYNQIKERNHLFIKQNWVIDDNNNDKMFKLMLLTIPIMPAYFISYTYFRIFRNTFVFLYWQASDYMGGLYKGRINNDKLLVACIIIFTALGSWLIIAYVETVGVTTLLSFDINEVFRWKQ